METNNTLLCVIAWENPGKDRWWQIIETRGRRGSFRGYVWGGGRQIEQQLQ